MLNFKNINVVTMLLFIGLVICNVFIHIPVLAFACLIFSWLLITSIGSFNIKWNYHLKALSCNKDYDEKHVAITFDDGPNPVITPQILELLNQYNAKATFFCIGKQIEKHPEVIRNIVSQKHTIGNHTYSHARFFDFFGKQKVIAELDKTNNLVSSITGKTMNLFRPPYGVTNPAITKAVKQTKHHVIGWNIRSLDTIKNSEQKILDRITKSISPGSVILLHDTKEITVRVLEQLLLFLKQNGYQSITIDALFNIEAYA